MEQNVQKGANINHVRNKTWGYYCMSAMSLHVQSVGSHQGFPHVVIGRKLGNGRSPRSRVSSTTRSAEKLLVFPEPWVRSPAVGLSLVLVVVLVLGPGFIWSWMDAIWSVMLASKESTFSLGVFVVLSAESMIVYGMVCCEGRYE
jgi:hypothetical protein